MKYLLTFGVIIFLGFLQTTLISFNFLLTFVLATFLFWSLPWAFFWAFFSGLIFDIFWGGRLGLGALGFFAGLFLLIAFRQRFSLEHPLPCFGVFFLAYLLFSLLTGRPVVLLEGVVLAALVAAFYFLTRPSLEVKE